MLHLKKSDFDGIVDWARRDLPNEACGLLAGRVDEQGDAHVERVFFCENADASNEHFTITPTDQLRALKEARADGLAMLGNWHSHPETPARPSAEDKRLANDPTANYLILSLSVPESPVLNAFRVDADKQVWRTPIELV